MRQAGSDADDVVDKAELVADMNGVQVIEKDTDIVANVSIKCLKCNHLFSKGVKSGLYRGTRAVLPVC